MAAARLQLVNPRNSCRTIHLQRSRCEIIIIRDLIKYLRVNMKRIILPCFAFYLCHLVSFLYVLVI